MIVLAVPVYRAVQAFCAWLAPGGGPHFEIWAYHSTLIGAINAFGSLVTRSVRDDCVNDDDAVVYSQSREYFHFISTNEARSRTYVHMQP